MRTPKNPVKISSGQVNSWLNTILCCCLDMKQQPKHGRRKPRSMSVAWQASSTTVSGTDRSHAICINICLWSQISLFSASTPRCLPGGAGEGSDTTNPTPAGRRACAATNPRTYCRCCDERCASSLQRAFAFIIKSEANGTQIKSDPVAVHFSGNTFKLKGLRTCSFCVDGNPAGRSSIGVRFTRSARATNAHQMGWTPTPTPRHTPSAPSSLIPSPILFFCSVSAPLLRCCRSHQHPCSIF